MTNAGFWDPLISPWWRSWGILFRATCQVYTTPVAIVHQARFVNPKITAVEPSTVPIGFRHLRCHTVTATWPRLRVLGGATMPTVDLSKVHAIGTTITTPKIHHSDTVRSFQCEHHALPLASQLTPTVTNTLCGSNIRCQLTIAPMLKGTHTNAVPMTVLKTTEKALTVPPFRRPNALNLRIPEAAQARLGHASLVLCGRHFNNLSAALHLPVIRSPLPAHRFKVDQRHTFRNELALRVSEVPPEKILIRYVVDRVPLTGVARFTPREDGTLSWTWAESQATQSKLPRSLHHPSNKTQLAGGGWVVVGQRLDTRSPVMTLVMPNEKS